MKTKQAIVNFGIAAFFVATFTSCSNEIYPTATNSEIGLISTYYVDINPIGGGPTVEVKYFDKDGDGRNPVITPSVVELQAGVAYTAEISLYNETESTVEDLTETIEDHKEDYLFCFSSTNTNVAVSYLDKDDHDLHVGLGSVWAAGESGVEGSIDIALHYQPRIKNGTCDLGKQRARISIPVRVVEGHPLNQ